MLREIDNRLTAVVLAALRAMGHGDHLLVLDPNFRADSTARQTAFGRLARMDTVDRAEGRPRPLPAIERFAFYDLAKQAYAVIQTGERRFHGCVMLRKGVIGPED